MWRLLIVSAVAVAISSFARAQTTETTDSQTPTTVLVLRFETPNDGADWIGRAVQEDLVSELTRSTTARIKAPFESRSVTDLDSAIKRAKDAHATHVVFGQAQSMEGMVRISGQVIDVESKKPLGTLKITGPRASLFDLEDALARQVCAVLPQDALKPEVVRALQENPPAPAIRLDDLEPEPIQIFPPYAAADYSVPERSDLAPTIVINVNTPSFDDFIPAYTTNGWVNYGPGGIAPYYYPTAFGYPYAWYGPGNYFGYPWGFYGGSVVVVNGGFNHRGDHVMHHRGFGPGPGFHGRLGGPQFAGNSVNGGFNGGAVSNGGLTFEFTSPGQPFFQGIPANGFRPPVPAGGFGVQIPQTGFTVGPRMGGAGMFRGPAFNGGVMRGGSAVR